MPVDRPISNQPSDTNILSVLIDRLTILTHSIEAATQATSSFADRIYGSAVPMTGATAPITPEYPPSITLLQSLERLEKRWQSHQEALSRLDIR
jgi:hypothetical protein